MNFTKRSTITPQTNTITIVPNRSFLYRAKERLQQNSSRQTCSENGSSSKSVTTITVRKSVTADHVTSDSRYPDHLEGGVVFFLIPEAENVLEESQTELYWLYGKERYLACCIR